MMLFENVRTNFDQELCYAFQLKMEHFRNKIKFTKNTIFLMIGLPLMNIALHYAVFCLLQALLFL